MNTILRTLIVWLVLLAVPFQGFASAAMLGCASGHVVPAHVVPPHTVPAPAVPDSGPVMHDGGHAHHGAHAGAAHTVAAPDAADGPHQMDHHGSAKCGACSACSIGAAMAPAPALALPVHAPPALTVPFAPGHMPAVDLALPERPPRPTLA